MLPSDQAIFPAYFKVMGSPQNESVDAQFSFVKFKTCTARTRRSGSGPLGTPSGRRTHAETSKGFGVPKERRNGL